MCAWLDEYVESVIEQQEITNSIFKGGILCRREKKANQKKSL